MEKGLQDELSPVMQGYSGTPTPALQPLHINTLTYTLAAADRQMCGQERSCGEACRPRVKSTMPHPTMGISARRDSPCCGPAGRSMDQQVCCWIHFTEHVSRFPVGTLRTYSWRHIDLLPVTRCLSLAVRRRRMLAVIHDPSLPDVTDKVTEVAIRLGLVGLDLGRPIGLCVHLGIQEAYYRTWRDSTASSFSCDATGL